MEELQLFPIVLSVRFQIRKDAGMHDTREEIVEQDVLIVEAHELLDLLKRQIRIAH